MILKLAGLGGVLLLALAVSLLWWQSHQLSSKVDTLTKQVSSLESRTVSRVGAFPENIEPLVNFIKGASRLEVLVDVAAYGAFSHKEGFLAYKHALIDVAKSKPRGSVRLFVYDNQRSRQYTVAQLKPDFERLKVKDKYAAFFARVGRPISYRWEEFIDTLQSDEEHTITEFQKADIAVVRVQEKIPIFVWLRDGKEALFSLYTLGQQPDEHTFRTREESLITLFNMIIRTAADNTIETSLLPRAQ